MSLDLLHGQHAEDGDGQDPTEDGCGGDAESGQAEGEVVIGVERARGTIYIRIYFTLQPPDIYAQPLIIDTPLTLFASYFNSFLTALRNCTRQPTLSPKPLPFENVTTHRNDLHLFQVPNPLRIHILPQLLHHFLTRRRSGEHDAPFYARGLVRGEVLI